jgi:hypothetical protein
MRKLVVGSLVLLAACAGPLLADDAQQTLPPEVYAQMKSGSKLGKVWVGPEFDGSKGIAIGTMTVDPSVVSGFSNAIDYFPYALRRLAFPDSPNVLSVVLVEMSTVDRGAAGYYSATVGVEGQIVDRNGKLVAAFRTREEARGQEDVENNLKRAMDKIVWAISKDLGKPFQRALELRGEIAKGTPAAKTGSGLVPAPPRAEQSQDVKSRLLRLEDLKQKGLITPEEYQTHREEILKGL